MLARGNSLHTDAHGPEQRRQKTEPSTFSAEQSASWALEKSKAVADALAQLGTNTDAAVVCEHLTNSGLEVDAAEVAVIRAALLKRASTPPGPDQPPPASSKQDAK